MTNDDGVSSPGIHILAEKLQSIGKTVVVAPAQERSTAGHSLTLHKPIRIEKLGSDFYSLNGTPADCVYLGVKTIMRGKVDLIISGINRGANLGQDIHYSGTVAGAREAAFMEIPSVALSLVIDFQKDQKMEFGVACDYGVSFADFLINHPIPEGVFLNINVPNLKARQIRGVRITRTGRRFYSNAIIEKKDPRGRSYYWLGGKYKGFADIPDSDCNAVHEKYVSVTPLHFDATHHPTVTYLREWILRLNL